MKTQKEIIDKIKKEKNNDLFGTIKNDLMIFLDLENIKPFLDDENKLKIYKKCKMENTVINIIKKMKDYLDFAFDKAETQRGLSANRSMDHYHTWIWLLNEEKRFGDIRKYEDYGISHLNKIKDFLEKVDETTGKLL